MEILRLCPTAHDDIVLSFRQRILIREPDAPALVVVELVGALLALGGPGYLAFDVKVPVRLHQSAGSAVEEVAGPGGLGAQVLLELQAPYLGRQEADRPNNVDPIDRLAGHDFLAFVGIVPIGGVAGGRLAGSVSSPMLPVLAGLERLVGQAAGENVLLLVLDRLLVLAWVGALIAPQSLHVVSHPFAPGYLLHG